MHILIVEVHVKPEMREKYLEVIKHDAVHSEQDEPGCLRFDLLQDTLDANTFFYYEVYRDEAALAAHRETPHFQAYFEHATEFTDRPTVRHVVRNIQPADIAWR